MSYLMPLVEKLGEAQKRVFERGLSFTKHELSRHMNDWEEVLHKLNTLQDTLDYLHEERGGSNGSETHIKNTDIWLT